MRARNPHKMSNIRFFYRLTTLFLFFLPPVFNVPKNLSLPSPALCASRIKHQTTPKGSSYYFTWLEKDTRNLFLNWLDARNWCRERCMDLISMETPEEINLVRSSMQKYRIKYSWTSGRLCDFKGCDRKDLQPLDVNGWFWSGSDAKMHATNERSAYNDWSYTGGGKKPQPDNREKSLGGYTESCMAVLNNYYSDGIKWHDVACHHLKSFVCEDSPKLLDYARRINTDLTLRF